MIRDIIEHFPKDEDDRQYATLTQATVTIADMGEKTITTQVMIDGDIVPDFSQDWEVEFQGEKYIMPLRIPQGAKSNESLNSTIDLTFQHWAVYQLKRWMFFTVPEKDAGTVVADKYIASVSLNLADFISLFSKVLEHYYGDAITISLYGGWDFDRNSTPISISHSYVWDVLLQLYELFAVRWTIEPNGDSSHYIIKVGYPATEVDHIFEYGFDGGLLKLERQVQSDEIRNMLIGRGGSKNLPYRYFKKKDEDNPLFLPDPDWVEEIANIYFTNLMPATFRSYVQGWKAAHISKYPGYTAVGESNAYAPWAYLKGYTDTKFQPVEFVADEITISPATGDKQVEILPGYSPYVKKGSSLDKYGPLLGGLDDNEDIFPTIQGRYDAGIGRYDEVLFVEEIKSDDVQTSTEEEARIYDGGEGGTVSIRLNKSGTDNSTGEVTFTGGYFTVPKGEDDTKQYRANLIPGEIKVSHQVLRHVIGKKLFWDRPFDSDESIVEYDVKYAIYNADGSLLKEGTNDIPPGNYYYKVTYYNIRNKSQHILKFTFKIGRGKIEWSSLDDTWGDTFDIWVKNIFGTSKGATETADRYTERVWQPVLGDRNRNKAAVVFSSGLLSVSEDYEFLIADVHYDRRKFTIKDYDGTEHEYDSEWRISLAKSDAELEATGLYLPNTKINAKAGDTFFLIGIELPWKYVEYAEKALDDYKKDSLREIKDIKPAFVVTTDRVRINGEGRPDALISQLRAGSSIRIADKRFIQPVGETAYETLYLQSVTYTYREPTSDDAALNPDVEVVLSDKYETTANPVQTIQGDVSALQRQLGSISNIEQVVRLVGDSLYLRKDGISDRSLSPTEFASLVTSQGFRKGIVGGTGWGIYRDGNGNSVIETDRIVARKSLDVDTIVANYTTAFGGKQIDCAANALITNVYQGKAGDRDVYICTIDTKGGSVGNLFHVDDIAMCQRFDTENNTSVFYKRRVLAVDSQSVSLAVSANDGVTDPEQWAEDSDVNGFDIPEAGDEIVHYGNYTDATRQYVKVRDVIDGGYERYIEGIDSVNSDGTEYYFVGRQAGMYNEKPRFFIGNAEGRHIKFEDGQLTLNAPLTISALQDSVEVGSENLISGTIDWFGWQVNDKASRETEKYAGLTVLHIDNSEGDGYENIARKIFDFEPDTFYTFSFYAKGSGELLNYCYPNVTQSVLISDGAYVGKEYSDGISARMLTGEWTRYYTVVKTRTKESLDDGETLKGKVVLVRANTGCDAYVCGIKVEKGNIPTGWSMSAEDIHSDLGSSDYIKKALQQDTSATGGLICTSLINLGYSEAGERRIQSGINGIPYQDKEGGGVAIWAGGDIDGDKTFAVNMDGTGHMAGKTVKFGLNEISVGDNVELNKDGLVLSDDEGEHKLRISNIPIPREYSDLNQRVPLSYNTSGKINLYSYKTTGIGEIELPPINDHIIPIEPGYPDEPPIEDNKNEIARPIRATEYFISGNYSVTKELGTVTANSVLNATLKFRFNAPVNNNVQFITPINGSGSAYVYYMEAGVKKIVWKSEGNSVYHEEGDFYAIKFRINTILNETASYHIQMVINENPNVISPNTGLFSEITIWAYMDGSAELGSKSLTMFGNDGVKIVWGESTFMIYDGHVGMMAKDNGFRITTGRGFEVTTDGGNTWNSVIWNLKQN